MVATSSGTTNHLGQVQGNPIRLHDVIGMKDECPFDVGWQVGKPELVVVRSPALLPFDQTSSGTGDRQADFAAAAVPSWLASSKTMTALIRARSGLP